MMLFDPLAWTRNASGFFLCKLSQPPLRYGGLPHISLPRMVQPFLKLSAIVLLLAIAAAAQSYTPADAIALEQQGNLREAARAWRSVVSQNPRDARAYATLGVVLAKQENYSEAVGAYR